MDLKAITVTQVKEAVSVYSMKGRHDTTTNRVCYGLSLCIDGQITYIQNERAYVSDKEHAVILPKGATYFVRRDKTGRFPVIQFDCLDFLCDTVTVIPIQNAEELLADYERIKKLFCFDGNRAQILSIFYGMLHKLSLDRIPCELKPAIHVINNEYCDPSLTNARLAAECNISEVYFRKLFTKHFNTSPKQFIIDVRLQRAKQLLSEGSLKLSAIAEQCGFSNPYHFCRIFKQHTGITPIKYRQENQSYEI